VNSTEHVMSVHCPITERTELDHGCACHAHFIRQLLKINKNAFTINQTYDYMNSTYSQCVDYSWSRDFK